MASLGRGLGLALVTEGGGGIWVSKFSVILRLGEIAPRV